MEMATIPQQKYLPVYPEWVDGWVYCLVTDCRNYDAYKALPHAIVYDGQEYRKTGWHGDKGEAYYKKDSGIQLALYKE